MVKNNRPCEFCGMTFERISNCDRHVKTIHANDTLMPVLSMVGSPEKCAAMNVDERKNEREILDVSFISDDGNIDMSIAEHEQLNSTSKEEVPPFVNLIITVPNQQEVDESLQCDLIAEMHEKIYLRDERLEKTIS